MTEHSLVEMYRHGHVSHGKLAERVGISRYETDALLKRYHVTEDPLTREEFEQQVRSLRKSLGQ